MNEKGDLVEDSRKISSWSRKNKKLIRGCDTRTWHRSILQPPLRSTLATEGFLWDDLCKTLHGGQFVAEVYEMAKKYCRKWVWRSNVADDRQTDGFAIAETRT